MIKFIYEYWGLCLSGLIECIALISALVKTFRYKRSRILTPLTVLVIGTFISAVIMFCFSENKNLLEAIHSTIRLFVVDYELSDIKTLFLQVLAIVAPILTFTAVLQLFKDTFSHLKLALTRPFNKYIFSELNEKSVTLAESIYQNCLVTKGRSYAAIVFTNVKDELIGEELYERARTIRAICFKKDISSVKIAAKKGKLCFFAISKTESDNIQTAAYIRRTYKTRDNTSLYIFSSSVEAEMFISSKAENEKIELHCIDEVRSVIYHKLYDMEEQRLLGKNETDLFSAAQIQGTKRKITAVILGLGKYGTEMLKALTWFCQMDGYQLEIHAFDLNASAGAALQASCPELLDGKHNHTFDDTDAQYDITIHSGIDIYSPEFTDCLKNTGSVTYALVSLGSDEGNVAAALYLRTLCEQNHCSPIIHAVVYNSDKTETLKDGANFASQKYRIEYIGDLKTMYSEDVAIHSKLEAQALNIHKQWGGSTQKFYLYGYNYRSSMASAIHLIAMVACGLRGVNVKEDTKVPDILEHRRWNAYMRTEGYIYGEAKNHLGKTHPVLVPFDALPQAEKDKDTRIALSALDINEPVYRQSIFGRIFKAVYVKLIGVKSEKSN